MIPYRIPVLGIMENVLEEEKRGILDSEYLTDSHYHDTIVLPECGHSKELLYEVPKENRRMAWNPFDFSFLSDNWVKIIKRVLEKHHVSLDEVKRFVFGGDKYGYTGVSSPIMALNEVWESLGQEDGYLIFCSVAAGYSMNAILYKL